MEKIPKKYFSLRHYLAILKRQPAHIQHVSAAVFAGVITALIAIVILYFDYGFWHERYSRSDVEIEETTGSIGSNSEVVVVQSPGEMLGGFFKEAATKFKNLNTGSTSILEAKEVYKRESVGDR